MNEKVASWVLPKGYVKNVAHGICLALNSENAAGQIYNVAEKPLTELDWVQAMDGSIPLRSNPNQKWEIDSTKIRKQLDYKEI